MDKIKLKDIVGYLPYGLKCKDTMGNKIVLVDERCDLSPFLLSFFGEIFGTVEHCCVSPYQTVKDDKIKPILFPMSCLVQEITINGETLVPIVELGKLCGYNKLEKVEEDGIITYGWDVCNGDDYSGYTLGWCEIDKCLAVWGEKIEGKPFYITNTTLSVYDKLNEWHFDYRGLIDKGLAVSALEFDNPYK